MFLFYPVLILALPFFFFYGLYKAIVPYTKKDEQKILQKFFDTLLSKNDAGVSAKEKESLQTVSQLLKRKNLLNSAPTQTLQSGPTIEVEAKSDTIPQSTPAQSSAPIDVGSALHSLENINILLYVGAFLLIVACSLFATYSYTFLDPIAKTFLLGVFSTLFYIGGLGLYTKTQKVKPAGITFTVIGLLTQPLVGLAAYNFIFSETHGNLIWFFTSLGCLVSYCLAYWLLRKQFLAYLISLSMLSAVVSLLLVQNVATYVIAYAMCLVSMAYYVFSKKIANDKDLAHAFELTSLVTLPIVLLCSLNFIDTFGVYRHTAMAFALGGLYYLVAYTLQEVGSQARTNFFTFSISLFPLGIVLLLKDANIAFLSFSMALYISGISLLYVSAMEVARQLKRDIESEILGIGAGVLSLIGVSFVFNEPSHLVFFAVFTTVINAYLTQRLGSLATHGMGIMGYLIIPLALSRYFGFEVFSVYSALLYSATTIVLYAKKYLYKEKKDFSELSMLSILVSFCVSLLFTQADFSYIVLLAYFLQCLFLLFVSYLEDTPALVGLAGGIVYVAVFSVWNFTGGQADIFSLSFAAVGSMIYVFSSLLEEKRRKILSATGILGLFTAALFKIELETVSFIPQIALFVAALMTYFECWREKSVSGQRFALGLVLASVQWMIYAHIFIHETHVYALMWSAYFAYLAYLESAQNRQNFTLLALVSATVPIGIKGLDSEIHGLFLLAQSFPMLFLGIFLKDKLVKYWSIAVLIIEVLYYMREFLLDLPGWVVFGVAGITVLAGGFYLLTRRKEE